MDSTVTTLVDKNTGKTTFQKVLYISDIGSIVLG